MRTRGVAGRPARLFYGILVYACMRRRSSKPLHQIKMARERIHILFGEADAIVKRDPKLAQRYMLLARKIGMRYNVRLTREQRRRVCRHCRAYLRPGVTSEHVVRRGTVRVRCLLCKKTMTLRYK